MTILGAEADADALDEQRKVVKENGKLQETARLSRLQTAHSQIDVGAAAGMVDTGSASIKAQHERASVISNIEQYAADYNRRYKLSALRTGATNARTTGYVTGSLSLIKDASTLAMAGGSMKAGAPKGGGRAWPKTEMA
jgi:hypothetical protein